MIKDGTIDINSLIGNNGGVNQPVGSTLPFMKMLDVLNMAQNNNNGNNNNPNNQFTQLKQMLELMQLMNQQQQPRGNDNMLMAYLLKQKESNNVLPMLTQMMQLTEKAQNYRMEALMSQLNSGQPQENPMNIFMKGIDFSDKRTGDARAKTKDEMDYDLRRHEIVVKEQGRLDMLNREERQIERDDKKSKSILDIGGVVLDKIVGDNLSTFVGDLFSMSSKSNNPSRRRGRKQKEPEEKFDVSFLDDLNEDDIND